MQSFQYEKPCDTKTIIELLAAGGGGARLLAGGTDLLVQIRARAVRPTLLVDVKGAPELRELTIDEEALAIGAAVPLNRLLAEHERLPRYAALLEAVSDLASYTIRNRATLVGNVSNASPCADTVPPLCVMEARAEVAGPGGVRTVPLRPLIVGVREVALGPGELVTRVIVPRPGAGSWSGFMKRKRVKGHDLALANAALLYDPERGRLRLAIGSCSPVPVVLELDEMLARPDGEAAAALAAEKVRPIDDVRASIEYRRDMVALMVRRLFARLAAERPAA